MPYCQNCGTEVTGRFCPNCGAEGGNLTPEFVIHKNVEIKPRYNVGVTLLAGWLGWAGIYMMFLPLIGLSVIGSNPSAEEVAIYLGVFLLGVVWTVLCYLPGINMIRKRTPKELVGKTIRSFIIRSLLFIICWGISLAGVFYIIGIFLKSWRLGLWASRPKFEEYTAFYNGEMIPVTKYYDDLPDYGPKGEYVYMDANGVFYRPPVK
jgi:hypothetical protein